MAFIPPTKIVFSGNRSACQEHIKFALNQLAILEKQMSFQSLNEGVRRISPYQGVYVECLSSFSKHEVRIQVDQQRQIKEINSYEEKKKEFKDFLYDVPLVAGVLEYFQLFNLSFNANNIPVLSDVWTDPELKRTASGGNYFQIKYSKDISSHGGKSSLAITRIGNELNSQIDTYVRAVLSWKKSIDNDIVADDDPIISFEKLIKLPPSLDKDTVYSSSLDNILFKLSQVELWCTGSATASFNTTKDKLYIFIINYKYFDNITNIRRITINYVNNNWKVASDYNEDVPISEYPLSVYIDPDGIVYGRKLLSSDYTTLVPCDTYVTSTSDPTGYNPADFNPVEYSEGDSYDYYTCTMDDETLSYNGSDIGSLGVIILDNDLSSVTTYGSHEWYIYLYGESTSYYHSYDAYGEFHQNIIYIMRTSGCMAEGFDYPVSKSINTEIYPQPGSLDLTLERMENSITILNIVTSSISQNFTAYSPPQISSFGHILGLVDETDGHEYRFDYFTGTLIYTAGFSAVNQAEYRNMFNVVGEYPLGTPVTVKILNPEITYPLEIDNAVPIRSFHSVDTSVDPILDIRGVYYTDKSDDDTDKWKITINDYEIQDEVFLNTFDSDGEIIKRITDEKTLNYLGFLF